MNIEKGYYYISTGAKTRMYTLRHYFQEMRCSHIENGKPQDVYWVERDWHLTNLSTDLESATEKAKAIAKRAGRPLAVNDNPESLEAIRRRNAEEMEAYRLELLEKQKIADAKRTAEEEERWASHSQDMFDKIKLGKMPYGIHKNTYLNPELELGRGEYHTPQGYLLTLLRKETTDLRWANINDRLNEKIREYYPAMEKALEMVSNGEYFGTPKKRETFNATLVGEFEFEGFYGITTIQKFITETGETVVYKGTSPKPFDIGETVNITATVKDHTVYRDEKQTGITRLAWNFEPTEEHFELAVKECHGLQGDKADIRYEMNQLFQFTVKPDFVNRVYKHLEKHYEEKEVA